MKPKILIDANALAHRARHTLGELTSETQRVGIIFGFLLQIQKLAKDNDTTEIIFCWDSNTSKRQKLFPEYKEARRTMKAEKTLEEKEEDKLAYQQFDILYDEVLPLLGFTNNYKIEGYEADDLIASIIYSNQLDDFLICSGDEDFYQLLCTGVTIKNGKGIFTQDDFIKEYGIGPLQWVDVKALAGCKSDGVPGIKGVGEATAIKYLKSELTPNLKTYQSIVSQNGKEIYKRNLKLVTLPFHNTPDIVLNKQNDLSFDGFIGVCKKYEFNSFLFKENLQRWKQILNLQ